VTEPRQLLQQLLDYIEEQAMDIDPQGFTLAGSRAVIRRREELAGLPGAAGSPAPCSSHPG
jgi:hypothetical protein